MHTKSAPTFVDYVWNNYRDLIDAEADYLSKLRALLFRGSNSNDTWSSLNAMDARYLQWDPADLEREVRRLDTVERDAVAASVAEKYAQQVVLNRCPSCDSLTVTPRSEHCIACGHTWYGTNAHR